MPDIEAIRARAEKATKGPWERIGDDLGCKKVAANVLRYDDEDGEVFSCDAIGWTPGLYDENADEANAQFIAHSITDVATLLSLTDSLAAERDELRREVERLKAATFSPDEAAFLIRSLKESSHYRTSASCSRDFAWEDQFDAMETKLLAIWSPAAQERREGE